MIVKVTPGLMKRSLTRVQVPVIVVSVFMVSGREQVEQVTAGEKSMTKMTNPARNRFPLLRAIVNTEKV